VNLIKRVQKQESGTDILYTVQTIDGDQYQVVHLIRGKRVLERIYFNYPMRIPCCIFRREYPVTHSALPSFQAIIEC
jgi:hypothetical protein